MSLRLKQGDPKGACVVFRCTNPAAPGRRFCTTHIDEMEAARVRTEERIAAASAEHIKLLEEHRGKD